MTAEYKNNKTNVREALSEQLNREQLIDVVKQSGSSSNQLILDRIDTTIDDQEQPSYVFVYDTSTDTDGGAWRNKSNDTGWYNETLGTSTRGTRRAFPAVAVIVSNMEHVTIYDADDPSMPMWMRFDVSGSVHSGHMIQNQYDIATCGNTAKNGCLYVWGSFITRIDFIRDEGTLWADNTGLWRWSGSIAERNDNYKWHDLQFDTSKHISTGVVNHAAVDVIPGDPVDPLTGMPKPSIVLATDSGVNFIDHLDTVHVNSSEGGMDGRHVAFTGDHMIIAHSDVNFAPAEELHLLRWNATLGLVRDYDNTKDPHTTYNSSTNAGFNEFVAIEDQEIVGVHYLDGNNPQPTFTKFARFKEPTTDDHVTLGTHANNTATQGRDMVAYISTDVNTGWIPGDSVMATLSDIKPGPIGHQPFLNLISSDTSSFNTVEEFQVDANGTLVVDGVNGNNAGKFTRTDNDSQSFSIWVNTSPGQVYRARVSVVQVDGPSARPYINAWDQAGEVLNSNGYPLGYMGDMYLTFRATTEQTQVRMALNSIGAVAWFDDLHVFKHDNLLVNTFDSEGLFYNTWTTSGGYPPEVVLDAGFQTTGVKLYTAATGGDSSITQTVDSSLDCHTISWEIVNNTGGFFGFFIDDVLVKDSVIESGSFTYNEPFSTFEVRHRGGSDGDNGVINNIQILPGVKNLEYGPKSHLSVHGQILRHPVAPGAELMGYSGWRSGCYIKQSLNTHENLGTGVFCMQGWIKVDKSHTEAGSYGTGIGTRQDFSIISIGDDTNNTSFHLHVDLTSSDVTEYSIDAGLLGVEDSFFGSGESPPRNDPTRASFKADVWNHWMVIRDEDGYMHVYANGVKADCSWLLSGVEAGPVDFNTRWTNPHLYIGTRSHLGGSADYFESGVNMALIRISKYIPSQKQITKIYRDEKALFTPNSKATVFGKMSAGVGVDYDNGTGLLHVLTEHGRSDFDGLRRVNQSAELGARRISATNGMIAHF